MVYNVILVIDLSEWMSSLLAATLDKTSSEVSLSMAGILSDFILNFYFFRIIENIFETSSWGKALLEY